MLTDEEVQWGYRYVLGREPEDNSVVQRQAQDFGDWRGFRVSLFNSDEFRELFFNSDEFKALQAARTILPADTQNAEDMIASLYRAILGRNPDPHGLEAHLSAMREGRSLEHVVKVFLASPEFAERSAGQCAPTATSN